MRDRAGWAVPGSLLAMLMLTGALGCGGPSDSPETQLPEHVRVTMIGATIGVGTKDGKQWDGPGQVPEALLSTVAGMLARKNPYVQIGSYLASLTIDLFEEPDPRGWAEVLNGATPVSRVILKPTEEDTLTPQWQDTQGQPPSLARVPLNAGTRIRVYLLDDDDPMPNDPIGECELRYQDLVEALEAQQVHHVNVAEQTNNQLLFVGIRVIPE